MTRRQRFLTSVAVLLGFGILLPLAPAASAAPPTNDDISGATALGPVPFHLEQDTTEATTSADEAALNDFCGAPTLEHGVWFAATPTVAATVVVDVTASDYSAGILVLSGEPGNLTPLLCSPGTVSGPVTPGQSLYLLVFGDGLTAETSGHLVLDTHLAPSPPSIDVTIDPRGTVDKTGVAHVTGTVTCASEDGDAFLFEVSGTIRQRVGRGFIDGFFFSEQGTSCDGVTRRWRADAEADGEFAGGKAATAAFAFGCGSFSCGEGYVEMTIQLDRRGR